MYTGMMKSSCCSFVPLFVQFSLNPPQKCLFFFARELRGLWSWNLVQIRMVDIGILYTWIRLLLLIHPFIHFSFQFSNIKNFHHTFLRNDKAYKVQTWYRHGKTVDGCILFTGIRLLLCICYFIFSFVFPPIFKHQNFSQGRWQLWPDQIFGRIEYTKIIITCKTGKCENKKEELNQAFVKSENMQYAEKLTRTEKSNQVSRDSLEYL